MTMPTNWTANAACKDLPLDLFFGDEHTQRHTAQTVCLPCPVLHHCHQHHLHTRHGLHAAQTEEQRRRRKPQTRPTIPPPDRQTQT